ncbi:MAG: hypothetical protein R6X18_07375 [Chloroflexota bacterium]|jgi:hypothetical protein
MNNAEYLEQVQYITDASGARSGVILSIEQFTQLLEDLEDLAVIAERRDEPTLSHEELLAELKDDGLLPG